MLLLYHPNVCPFYSTYIEGLRNNKEENKPLDSRCGSVETCRNARTVLPGTGESMREESAYLESRNYGKRNPEKHQEDLPVQWR